MAARSVIYTITAPSGSQYVGSSMDMKRRKRSHTHLLRYGIHHSPALQRACWKYGIEKLIFQVILVCRQSDLILFEQRAIDVLKPKYNVCPLAGTQSGRRGPIGSRNKTLLLPRKSFQHTPEWRSKTAERMMGNKLSQGISPSQETRERLSRALQGKKHSDGFEAKVTEDDKKQIVSDYLNGSGQLAIASKFRTSHKAIRPILIAAGVAVHPSGFSIKQDGS